MNNIDNLKFSIGPFGDNRWLALSFHSPYFCFEAESEEALLAVCKKAVAFCRKAAAHIEDSGSNSAVRMSPAMAAGITDTLLDWTDLVKMIDAYHAEKTSN